MSSGFMSSVVTRLFSGKGKDRNTNPEVTDNTQKLSYTSPSSNQAPVDARAKPAVAKKRDRRQTANVDLSASSSASAPKIAEKTREVTKRKSPLFASLRKRTRPLSCFIARPESPTDASEIMYARGENAEKKSSKDRDRQRDEKKNSASRQPKEKKQRRPLSCIVQPPSPRLIRDVETTSQMKPRSHDTEDSVPLPRSHYAEDSALLPRSYENPPRRYTGQQKTRPVSCFVASPLQRSPPPYCRRPKQCPPQESSGPSDQPVRFRVGSPQSVLPSYLENSKRSHSRSASQSQLPSFSNDDSSARFFMLYDDAIQNEEETLPPYAEKAQESVPFFQESRETALPHYAETSVPQPPQSTQTLNQALSTTVENREQCSSYQQHPGPYYGEAQRHSNPALEKSRSSERLDSSYYTSSRDTSYSPKLQRPFDPSTPPPQPQGVMYNYSYNRDVSYSPRLQHSFDSSIPPPEPRGTRKFSNNHSFDGSYSPKLQHSFDSSYPLPEPQGTLKFTNNQSFDGNYSPKIRRTFDPSTPPPQPCPNRSYDLKSYFPPARPSPSRCLPRPQSACFLCEPQPCCVEARRLRRPASQCFLPGCTLPWYGPYPVTYKDEQLGLADTRSPYKHEQVLATNERENRSDYRSPYRDENVSFPNERQEIEILHPSNPKTYGEEEVPFVAENGEFDSRALHNGEEIASADDFDSENNQLNESSEDLQQSSKLSLAPGPFQRNNLIRASVRTSYFDRMPCSSAPQKDYPNYNSKDFKGPLQDEEADKAVTEKLPEQPVQDLTSSTAPDATPSPARTAPVTSSPLSSPKSAPRAAKRTILPRPKSVCILSSASESEAFLATAPRTSSPRITPRRNSPTAPTKGTSIPRPKSACLLSADWESEATVSPQSSSPAASPRGYSPSFSPPPPRFRLQKYRSADCLDRVDEVECLDLSPPPARPLSYFTDPENSDETENGKKNKSKRHEEIFTSMEMLEKLGQPRSRHQQNEPNNERLEKVGQPRCHNNQQETRSPSREMLEKVGQPRYRRNNQNSKPRPVSCFVGSSSGSGADESGYLSNGTLGGSGWLGGLSASTGDILEILDGDEMSVADDELSFERASSFRKAWSVCSLLAQDSIQDRSFTVMRRRRQKMKNRRDTNLRSSSTETDEGVDLKGGNSASSLLDLRADDDRKEEGTGSGLSSCIPLDGAGKLRVPRSRDQAVRRLHSVHMKAWEIRLRRKQMLMKRRSCERLNGINPRTETLV